MLCQHGRQSSRSFWDNSCAETDVEPLSSNSHTVSSLLAHITSCSESCLQTNARSRRGTQPGNNSQTMSSLLPHITSFSESCLQTNARSPRGTQPGNKAFDVSLRAHAVFGRSWSTISVVKTKGKDTPHGLYLKLTQPCTFKAWLLPIPSLLYTLPMFLPHKINSCLPNYTAWTSVVRTKGKDTPHGLYLK